MGKAQQRTLLVLIDPLQPAAPGRPSVAGGGPVFPLLLILKVKKMSEEKARNEEPTNSGDELTGIDELLDKLKDEQEADREQMKTAVKSRPKPKEGTKKTGTEGVLQKLEEETDAELSRRYWTKEHDAAMICLLLDSPEVGKGPRAEPNLFHSHSASLVVASYYNLLDDYGEPPTRRMVKEDLTRSMTEDDNYDEVFELLKPPKQSSSTAEIRYCKTLWREMIDEKMSLPEQILTDEYHQAIQQGEYKLAREIVINNATKGDVSTENDPLEVHDIFDALDAADAPISWIIEGLLIHNHDFAFGAEEKALKSYMCADLAVSVATGTPFLNHFPVPEPRKILWFSSEWDDTDVGRALNRMMEARGLTRESYIHKPGIIYRTPDLTDEGMRQRVGQIIKREKADLVILDCCYKLMNDDKADARMLNEMGKVYSRFSEMVKDNDATTLFVQHFKKGQSGQLSLSDMTGTGLAQHVRHALLWRYIDPQHHDLERLRLHAKLIGKDTGYKGHNEFDIAINENKWNTLVQPWTQVKAAEGVKKSEDDAMKALDWIKRLESEGVKKISLTKLLEKNLGAGKRQEGIFKRSNAAEKAIKLLIENEDIEAFREGKNTYYRSVKLESPQLHEE